MRVWTRNKRSLEESSHRSRGPSRCSNHVVRLTLWLWRKVFLLLLPQSDCLRWKNEPLWRESSRRVGSRYVEIICALSESYGEEEISEAKVRIDEISRCTRASILSNKIERDDFYPPGRFVRLVVT